MKNRLLVLAMSMLVAGFSMAQSSTRIGSHDAINWQPSGNASSFDADQGRQIADKIMATVGLKPNFEIRQANVPNAAAITYAGKRYILYNPNFLSQLQKSTGTQWAGVSVLAHEIGHHLNGHTVTNTGSDPASELEADEFSGFVLRKMGASLTEAQAAMKTVAQLDATGTHPGRDDRLASIELGWDKAEAQISGKDIASVKPRVSNTPRTAAVQTASASSPSKQSAVLGFVRFNADPSTRYFITSQFNLVQYQNNKASVIGKLSELNNRNYPYILSDDTTQLVVDRYGNILTRQGKQIGTLTPNR